MRHALLAALLFGMFLACGAPEPAPQEQLRFSFLAVGDAGAHPDDAEDYPPMLRVARAMAREHQRRPVQALFFLGDNFYARGLRREELEKRIRANLVRPYCSFLALDGARSSEVAASCAVPADERNPVPIHATLGNHDYGSPESPALQREAVPDFVSNWSVPSEPAAVVELTEGLSVILLDSELVFAGGDSAPLEAALRRSRGPWRVVVTHRPVFLLRKPESPGADHARENTYVRRVREAMANAGVPVQLLLAGHEHSLQVLRDDPPAPALHVVAGGGSDTKALKVDDPHRLMGLRAHGYARVDLVGPKGAARLVATLYRLPPGPLARIPGWQWEAARYAVDLAGNVVRE